MIRVGFGVTVWSRSLVRGHLDGLGVYTQNLWRAMKNIGCDLRGVSFGTCEETSSNELNPLDCMPINYNVQAALSILVGTPFVGAGKIESSIDIFHATDHHIPKLHRVPVVATIMDAIPLVHPEWVSQTLRPCKNFAFRRSVQWAEHILTISEFSKRDIVDYFDIPADRISTIPLGVNEQFFQRVSSEECETVLKRYSVPPNCFVFVGTLQPRKNVRRIINAHRALSTSVKREHPLLIIGKNVWRDDELAKDLRNMESDGCGRWLNNVPTSDLLALLQSALVLVYPSLYEGFGLPVLEGFAAGIPVISSNTTAIPEVAGDAALLVNPLDIEEISNAMEKIEGDKCLSESLVIKGKQRLDNYSWEKCANKTIDVYKKVIS